MQVDGIHLFWYRQDTYTFFEPSQGLESLIANIAKFQLLDHQCERPPDTYPKALASVTLLKELYYDPHRNRIKSIPFRSVEKLYQRLFDKIPIISGLKVTGHDPRLFRSILEELCNKYACMRLDPKMAEAFLSLPSGKIIKHLRKGTYQAPSQAKDKLVPTLLFYVPEREVMPTIQAWEERHIYPVPLNPIYAALDEDYLIQRTGEVLNQRGWLTDLKPLDGLIAN